MKRLIAYIKRCRLPKDDIRNPKHNPYELLFKWLYRFGQSTMEIKEEGYGKWARMKNRGGLDIEFPVSDEMAKVIEEENKLKGIDMDYKDIAETAYKNGYEKGVKDAVDKIQQAIVDNTYPYFDKDGKPVNIWKATTGFDCIDEIVKKIKEGKP